MVIIEGLDGVGKTTLVDYLVENGLKKYHFDYDENNLDIYTKYINVLNQDTILFLIVHLLVKWYMVQY